MNTDMMKELARLERLTEGFRARREPDANKLTLTMNPGVALTYRRFEAGTNRDGEEVSFCVADHTNTAGYVLSWRETQKVRKNYFMDQMVRVGDPRRRQFSATKYRATALRLAERRAEKFKARVAKLKAAKDTAKALKLNAAVGEEVL